ncbi:MAG: hypothetical protein Q8S73_18230 [Deltaproteobacteria bacterium]|nr:hypothetical protein [Deltaproteobacteria bacterium]
MKRPLALLALLIPFSASCGGDDAGHDGQTQTDAATDLGVVVDTPAADQDAATADAPVTSQDTPTVDAPLAIPMLNDCTAMDYMDLSGGADTDRVVRPRGTTGYTPRCVIIRAGQSVTFEMDFAVHPLVPGIPHGPTAGATRPNPIARQSSGTTYVAAFANAGHYPFYCGRHGHVGMAGVVRVIP